MYVCVCVCVCVGSEERDVNEVLCHVYVISRVHHGLGCVIYILLTLFSYCFCIMDTGESMLKALICRCIGGYISLELFCSISFLYQLYASGSR